MIQTIVDLAGCSLEDAKRVYDEVGDVSEALDRLIPKSVHSADKYINKLRPVPEVTEEQQWCRYVRGVLKTMDDKRSTSASQPEPEERSERCIPHEETVQQSNCSQECQLPSLQSEVQTQETAYPSQSECSSDLQSIGQK
jgi:hypothetical protein